jgi:hypothetical protein
MGTINSHSASISTRSDYLAWLCNIAGRPSSGVSYQMLLEYLYTQPFVVLPSMPEDFFRESNGQSLRRAFGKELTDLHQTNDYRNDRQWLNAPCSMLEMMIALARNIAILTDHSSDEQRVVSFWFWKLAFNLGFEPYSDELNPHGEIDTQKINQIIHTLVYREYDNYGRGSLFPLDNSIGGTDRVDFQFGPGGYQKLEIWDQMKNYLSELGRAVELNRELSSEIGSSYVS